MPQPFVTRYETIPGLIANADLSAQQFKVVSLQSTAGVCQLAATSILVSKVVGVLQNNPKSGEAAEVAYSGIVKAIAGTSTIVVGSVLGVNTTSRVVGTTTDNVQAIGKSLMAASAIGDIINVLLTPGGARY
jgi:hypothetical protein